MGIGNKKFQFKKLLIMVSVFPTSIHTENRIQHFICVQLEKKPIFFVHFFHAYIFRFEPSAAAIYVCSEFFYYSFEYDDDESQTYMYINLSSKTIKLSYFRNVYCCWIESMSFLKRNKKKNDCTISIDIV